MNETPTLEKETESVDIETAPVAPVNQRSHKKMDQEDPVFSCYGLFSPQGL